MHHGDSKWHGSNKVAPLKQGPGSLHLGWGGPHETDTKPGHLRLPNGDGNAYPLGLARGLDWTMEIKCRVQGQALSPL